MTKSGRSSGGASLPPTAAGADAGAAPVAPAEAAFAPPAVAAPADFAAPPDATAGGGASGSQAQKSSTVTTGQGRPLRSTWKSAARSPRIGFPDLSRTSISRRKSATPVFSTRPEPGGAGAGAGDWERAGESAASAAAT